MAEQTDRQGNNQPQLCYLISTNVASTTTLQQLKLLGVLSTDVESLLLDGHWRHCFQRPDGSSPPQTHADQTCSILAWPPLAPSFVAVIAILTCVQVYYRKYSSSLNTVPGAAGGVY